MTSTNPIGGMGGGRGVPRGLLQLEFPQSLAVYEEYSAAQRAVDFLSDREFPVENCMIVGTDLKQVERITGRITTPKVALGGILTGLWLGVFVGIVFALFDSGSNAGTVITTAIFGALFGMIWALIGYALTRGQRDFSSVRVVVATRYEVLVEHKLLQRAKDLLAQLPGGRPDPFA
jgi:xanthosine utilization system XapX-like protein